MTFGPGGEVAKVDPAATSSGRVQMCNVSCVWYLPSKTASIEFRSIEHMEEASKKLLDCTILGRKLECRTVVNKKSRPWVILIKVGNLATSTTEKMIRGVCKGHQPKQVLFGDVSYSASTEEISETLRRLLTAVGTIEAWATSPSTKSTQYKATATFSTADEATKVIRTFNGHSMPQLGGSRIFLSYMVKAKFSILTPMFDVVKTELQQVTERLQSRKYLEIKFYKGSPKEQRFTTVHVLGDTADDVGKAKTAVESILKGHTARGGHGIVWDELFLKREGMAYLKDLGTEHDVFIYRDARRQVLSLYGSEENKAVVESTLIKVVEDLAKSSFKIDLDDRLSPTYLRNGYRTIVEKLGKSAARLTVTTNSKTLTIYGLPEDFAWAKEIILKASDRHEQDRSVAEDLPTCAVCWCDISETYTTPCGHAYDRDCFVNQCSSASGADIPVKCLGSSGDCQKPISLIELESVLTRDQVDRFLETSFTHYVRTHPKSYQYCPTAGCDQVYQVDMNGEGKTFTCPTCMTSVCTVCASVSHEGLTCEQNKNTTSDDKDFMDWKRKNNAKDCPKCGCTIQKSEGCNHMQCKVCKTHICWICLGAFDTGSDTYGHLTGVHGGFYDPGYGDI